MQHYIALILLLACSACSQEQIPALPRVFSLGVAADAHERYWQQALAEHLNAKQNVDVKYGRADLATETHIFEIDRLDHYHEGIGQAWHYAQDTGLQPVLALIITPGEATNPETAKRLKYIREDLCQPLGIQLVELR